MVELLGVIFALPYLLLAMVESRLCWIAAIISSVCYIEVFFSSQLYTESGLQLFFIVLSVQGLRRWNSSASDIPLVTRMSYQQHLTGCALCLVVSAALGTLLFFTTGAPFAFVDSALTVFSVYTSYLVTEKILENWLYWIGIDLIAAVLYLYKGLFLTAGLFFLYVILAAIGYLQWKRTELTFSDIS